MINKNNKPKEKISENNIIHKEELKKQIGE